MLVKDLSEIPIINIPKPILKWVGGKTQIIHTVLSYFPVEMKNYREIFLGGGSVLLGLLAYKNANIIHIKGDIYVYDINRPLISMYKNIQSNPEMLYKEISKLIVEYNNITHDADIIRKPNSIHEALTSRESYYYWIRKQYNNMDNDEKDTMFGSAMFIFLNKTCFRGMYRVSRNGFNVPYGNYKNPSIINKEHLIQISSLIQNVHFKNCGYTDSMTNICKNDFVYLDPPYVPEKITSFVKYTDDGFTLDNHTKLFSICNQLQKRYVRFLMSNSNTELVTESFPDNIYNVYNINCKRAINSKKPNSTTLELLIHPI